MLFLGICLHIFSRDFLWVFLFIHVSYFGLACDDGNSFLCVEEYVCMYGHDIYVCMYAYSRVWINRVRLPVLLVVS